MKINKLINGKSYAIYGLGLSGKSAFKFLKKKNVKKIYIWDDKKKFKNNKSLNVFKNALSKVDYIVVSPGINLKKTRFNSILAKNKKKIITDLDLFYMQMLPVKSIMVTGTNGKSTTCKLIQHVLKANSMDAQLGGNIGKPILDLKIKKKNIVIIEASSLSSSACIRHNSSRQPSLAKRRARSCIARMLCGSLSPLAPKRARDARWG